jgi:hypothetical protein
MHPHTILFAAAVLVALHQPARAGDPIVLESFTGGRPDDANRLLSPVLDELAARGFVSGPDVVGRRFEQRVSRVSSVDGALARFAETVERGHRAWVGGQFEEALKILTPMIDLARTNSGAFAQNQPLREQLLKALVAAAISHRRIGDQDAARRTITEIVRSFPDYQISRAIYGPEAFELFETTKKKLASEPRGKLVITVSDPTGAVFINERFSNVGSVMKPDLLPGEYRIVVQTGKRLSRTHVVTVSGQAETPVTIDTDFDRGIVSSPRFCGMEFADAAQRERLESLWAAAFANAIDARGVIVVGIDNVKGRPAVVATLVSLLSGREVRRASIPLDPEPAADRLRTLARFIAGDNVAPGIDITLAGEAGTAAGGNANGSEGVGFEDMKRRPLDGPSSIWGGWKWLTGGVGLVAMGVGGYLLSVDGDCTDEACTYNRETSVTGWLGLGGGIVLTGISVYLFVRGDGESSAPDRGAFVVPTHGGAYAGYALTF